MFASRPALKTTQPPIQSEPWGKARPGRDAHHLPHLVPRTRMSKSYTSYRLHGGSRRAFCFIGLLYQSMLEHFDFGSCQSSINIGSCQSNINLKSEFTILNRNGS
jgi:hypothetical protein